MSTNKYFRDGEVPNRLLPSLRISPRLGFVSTYPPTMCGLATFTSSLRGAIAENRGNDSGLDVVELANGHPPSMARPEVVGSLDPSDMFSVRLAADRLSDYDAVIIQHEYGIWGPDMGLPVVEFVERIQTPLITTLHTVLPSPSKVQEDIIEALWLKSAYTVVPTHAARDLLSSRYSLDPRSIVVIPHGTDPSLQWVARLRGFMTGPRGAPNLLTWGLIGPGKGLEWTVQAVARLKSRYPDIVYTIAGKTHPKVALRDGESYRKALEKTVSELGLQENVRFIDDYISPDMLREVLLETSVVVVPYDSTEQIVSGVLVEAVAANVPVVATAFPHAVELAEQRAVVTVPHRDPDAIAEAIARILGSTAAWEQMMGAQRAIAPELEWGSVAMGYERLVDNLVIGSAQMSHVSPAS